MGVVDRTDEFRQILSQLSLQGHGGGPDIPAPQPQVQSQLNAFSSEIGTEIHQASQKLQELRKMARAKGIFNDRTNEIQELTYSIKQDMERLGQKVEVLEKKAKGAGPNRSYQAHSMNMVETLKARLVEVGKEFKDVLEVRTKALEQQDDRRKMYSFTGSQASNPFGQKPRPMGNADDLEGGSSGGGGGQAMSLVYHNSRAEAMQSVQRTLGDLATMFQKLAVMVTSQEEMLQRVDKDVDDTLSNVEQGQEHLLRYFQHISSNRWLIIKVFMILITFVVFFVVFIA